MNLAKPTLELEAKPGTLPNVSTREQPPGSSDCEWVESALQLHSVDEENITIPHTATEAVRKEGISQLKVLEWSLSCLEKQIHFIFHFMSYSNTKFRWIKDLY